MVRDAKQEAAKLRNSFAADRRQELAAEQSRLEAVQRIQCQVRGWQGRKTAKAKRSRDKQKASLATERREKLLQPPPLGVRRTYRAPNIGAVPDGFSSPKPDRTDSPSPSRSEADPPPEPEPDETTESPGHPAQSTPCIDSSEGPTHVGSDAGQADVLSQPRSPSRSPQPSPSQSRSRSPSRASDELSCASREPSPGPDERSERSASGSATSSKSQSRPSKRSTGHQRKKQSSRDSATPSSRSSDRSPSRSPSPSPRSVGDPPSEVPSLGSAD